MKLKVKSKKAKGRWRPWAPAFYFCLLTFASLLSPSARGASQQDVFKSIETNVDGPVDARTFMALLLAAASAVLFLAYISRRRKKKAVAQAENHPGRLLREISKKITLDPADLKRLKAMQARAKEQGIELQSPLTLMLCPSVLGKVMKGKKE